MKSPGTSSIDAQNRFKSVWWSAKVKRGDRVTIHVLASR
jgi:hypothetical protein